MSKMRKQSGQLTDCDRYIHRQQSQRLRLHKGLSGLCSVQYPGDFVWLVRNGKRKTSHYYKNEGDTCMSKLRQSFLEAIRIMGNHSGCHQMPERSFFYKGKQFPVCARCTGVTIGEFLTLVLLCFRKVLSLPAAIGCLAIMGMDWGIQALHIKESTNLRRLITGFFGGIGVITVYIHAARFILQLVKKKICHQ